MAKKESVDDLNAQIAILNTRIEGNEKSLQDALDKNEALEKELSEALVMVTDQAVEIEKLKDALAVPGTKDKDAAETETTELTNLDDLLDPFYEEGQNIRRDFPKNKILNGAYVYIDAGRQFISVFCTSKDGKEFCISKEKFSHEALNNTIKSLEE